MALTEEQVVEALRPVQDPEIHRSIVDLEMVRAVTISGSDVKVLVALTVAGCPLRTEITKRVTEAVQPLPGVARVDVELTVMTPDELDALRQKLNGGGHDHGHDHGGQGHTFPTGAGGDAPDIVFNRPGNRTRVLAVTSGKGGVGKSSVSVNLAIALAGLGKDVAILDADVYGFSIPKMLGTDAGPTVLDKDLMLPVPAHGVRMISLGVFVEDDTAVPWRGPMLHQLLREFLTKVYWGEPDFLVVDMPPGTGDVALSVAQYLPRAEVYVVTTPQPAAQRVAQRAAMMARGEKINQPVMGVIENMSWFTGDDGRRYELFGAGGGAELAAKLEVPLLGQIPLVPEVRQGGDVGLPVTVADPGSEVALAFQAIAKQVEANPPAPPKRRYRPELAVR